MKQMTEGETKQEDVVTTEISTRPKVPSRKQAHSQQVKPIRTLTGDVASAIQEQGLAAKELAKSLGRKLQQEVSQYEKGGGYAGVLAKLEEKQKRAKEEGTKRLVARRRTEEPPATSSYSHAVDQEDIDRARKGIRALETGGGPEQTIKREVERRDTDVTVKKEEDGEERVHQIKELGHKEELAKKRGGSNCKKTH